MKPWKLLLLPFSIIYGAITAIRNKLYDFKVLSSFEIPIKSICVGNLSVGGTGKSPLVILLAEYLIKQGYTPAILSRGYGRKTKGLIEVNMNHQSSDVGDELLQYQNRFSNRVKLVASESRKKGVQYILDKHQEVDIILLDDAYQHRKIKAGFNIVVTPYHKPFFNDFILPMGYLRELKSGIKRSNATVISKCPSEISALNKKSFEEKCGKNVHFSRIKYGDIKGINGDKLKDIENLIVVTGIGDPLPLIQHLSSTYSIKHIEFKDHHNFSAEDFKNVADFFGTFAANNTVVITTEKDYMRVRDNHDYNAVGLQWCYQEMNIELLDDRAFFETIDNYVRTNS